ncbi:MAG: transposase [Parabacteroides sp.]|nr:transposase [Parabacteroides sp.]
MPIPFKKDLVEFDQSILFPANIFELLKKQISFADKEARIMGKKGDFDYAYNGQIAVDKDNQIIVGQYITQNANDKQEVKHSLQEIEDTTGKLPVIMSMDNGYMSGVNLEDKTNIDVYIATGKGENNEGNFPGDNEQGIKESQFTYDTEKDCFVCPGGHTLELKSNSSDGKKIYQAQSDDCDCCPCRSKCCTSKRGEPRTTSDDKEPLRKAMAEKMKQEESRSIYKKRKTIVEPVFGQIKAILGFRGFSVRGLIRAGGEFSLICSVHNIKKIVNAIKSAAVSCEDGIPPSISVIIDPSRAVLHLLNHVVLLLVNFTSIEQKNSPYLHTFSKRLSKGNFFSIT